MGNDPNFCLELSTRMNGVWKIPYEGIVHQEKKGDRMEGGETFSKRK